jgi:putative oxidoreductase
MINWTTCTTIREKLQTLSPLIWLGIRLSIGITFALTGYGKLTHLNETTQFFESLHIPYAYANAIVASSVELLGGIALCVGLLTRLAAFGLTAIMGVAIVTAKAEELTSITNLIAFQEWDYILFLLLLVVTGAGKLSLDHFVFNREKTH